MAYPYIGKSRASETIILFISVSTGVSINSENAKYHDAWDEDVFENITADYLRNTYGKVESKEHADFIVKLAESVGIRACSDYDYDGGDEYFSIADSNLYFWFEEPKTNSENKKLINLPRPNKGENMSKVQVNVKNNTDSVVQVTKSDDEKNIFIHVNDLPKESEEWQGDDVKWRPVGKVENDAFPHAGDEVSFPSGKGILVVDKPDINGVVIVKSTDAESIDEYKKVSLSAIKKPSTPEEELKEKLIKITDKPRNQELSIQELIAKAIINGEIKGLSYKPD